MRIISKLDINEGKKPMFIKKFLVKGMFPVDYHVLSLSFDNGEDEINQKVLLSENNPLS
jgi:hypothetical protein